MRPKVEAAARFARSGGRAVIGSLSELPDLVAGTAGTQVVDSSGPIAVGAPFSLSRAGSGDARVDRRRGVDSLLTATRWPGSLPRSSTELGGTGDSLLTQRSTGRDGCLVRWPDRRPGCLGYPCDGAASPRRSTSARAIGCRSRCSGSRRTCGTPCSRLRSPWPGRVLDVRCAQAVRGAARAAWPSRPGRLAVRRSLAARTCWSRGYGTRLGCSSWPGWPVVVGAALA